MKTYPLFFIGFFLLSFFLYMQGVLADPNDIVDELIDRTTLPHDQVVELGLIPTTIRFILSIFSVLLTGVALYAGYLFIANFGDEESISKAKKLIVYAMAGIVVTAVSYAVISGVISLDFSQTEE